MTIIDTYVVRLFLKILVVAFMSLAGIFVVFDAVGSLDDFLAVSQEEGNLVELLIEYYGPQTVSLYNQLSPLLSLVACIFTITFLQRSNELTAIRAAGISQMRVVRPMLMAAAVLSLVAAANRELVIPKYRSQITRRIQDWTGEKPEKVHPRYDHDADILINGRHLIVKDQRIVDPNFRLHRPLGSFHRRVVAASGYYQEATDQHGNGYLMKCVRQPAQVDQLESFAREDRKIIYTRRDHPWLNPGEIFVSSEVAFDSLREGNSWHHYASVPELLEGLWNPSHDHGADVKVTVHARFLQPVMDMVLLFLALPLVLAKNQRNIMVAAGTCILIVIGFYVVTLASHAMGSNAFLLSPTAAAWVPLLIFGPIAYTVSKPLWT